VYLYVLNGSGDVNVDNNDGYSLLVHAAPELLNGQLKFLGSLGTGKWDDDNKKDFIRYALGASYQTGPVTVRGEYMGGKWEDEYFVTDEVTGDVEPNGYYLKVLYQFHPRFTALAGYNHLEHDFTGFFFTDTTAKETYDGYVLGLDFSLADGTTVMLTYNHLEGDRSDDSATLDTDRLTLGVRTDF
jgi:predicted porin